MTAGADLVSPPAQPAVRRYLTLLFSDLCESTNLAAAIEAEHYGEILGQLRQAYEDIFPRHGGTVVRIQGDGVLAIFGLPEALEDDGRRATEAALELHAAVRGLRPSVPLPNAASLRLHTGIHAGLVLLGQGDLMRGRFELMGNAPNIAARLSDLAEPDEILISDETLGPVRQLFVAGARRHLSLHGLSNPVVVLPILSRASIDPRFEPLGARAQLPFVGRHAEIRRLETALQEAHGGHCTFVAIAATSGLGKTRLAGQFLRHCADSGCQVHRGYCESHLGTKPLQPFVQLLQALLGVTSDTASSTSTTAEQVERRLAGIAPDLGHLLAPLLQAMSIDDGRGDAAGQRRGAAADAVPSAFRELFAGLAQRQTQVLFIDDWQWADDATHRALDAIQQLAGGAILTLVATRGSTVENPAPHRMETLELQPLSNDESAHYIDQLLPGANPFLVDQIRDYAGGSPLFIEELCHCAADDLEVRRTGRLQRGAAWLNVLIESRVARLQDAQAALVRSAAVIGNVMPAWLFESVTGFAPEHPVVRQLAALDIVFPGEQPGTLRFKHAVARDAIYDSVGLHQRKALHLQVAQVLLSRGKVAPGEDHCEALAYHFGAAGLADQAARYAEQAGDKAMAASALDRAQAQYRAALAALDRSEPSAPFALRWNAISQRLGLACVFNPARSELPLFQRALALAETSGSEATIARATYWLGYIHYALGDARQAVRHSEQALISAGRAHDDRLVVQVRATLGQAKVAAAQYGPALTLLDEAITVKRAHRSGAGQAVGLAFTLASKGSLLGDRGQFTAALTCFDEALEVVQGTRHEVRASIHGLRAAVLLWQGEWEAALRSATEAFRIGEQVRSLFTLSMGRAAAAYATWMLESQPEALHALQHATDWLAPRGITLFRSLNHGWLADGFASCGQHREARAHAAQALRRWREHDLIGGAMACRAMARLSDQEGDSAHADRWLARARTIAGCRESAHEQAANTLCEAGIALDRRQGGRAAELLDHAARDFAALGMRWHESQAVRLQQRL